MLVAMGRLEIQERYEEYIAQASPAAMAIGRRMPYHLEYLRRHGTTGPTKPEEVARQGKEGLMEA